MSTKPHIFISWSGTQSHAIAGRLRLFLSHVMPECHVWFSDEGLVKGRQWMADLVDTLRTSCVAAIAIYTPENTDAEWILFECAMIHAAKNSPLVIPATLSVQFSELSEPMRIFMGADLSNEDEMRRIIGSISDKLGDLATTDKLVRDRYFDLVWPDFAGSLKELSTLSGSPVPEDTSEHGEVVNLLNDILKQVSQGASAIDVRAHAAAIRHAGRDQLVSRTMVFNGGGNYTQFRVAPEIMGRWLSVPWSYRKEAFDKIQHEDIQRVPGDPLCFQAGSILIRTRNAARDIPKDDVTPDKYVGYREIYDFSYPV